MKNIFFTLIALLIYINAFCIPPDSTVLYQKNTVYHINPAFELSIIGIGLVGDYFAIPRLLAKKSITDSEIADLNPDLLNPIDRMALNQNTTNRGLYKNIADYGLAPYVLIPAFLLIDKKIKKDWFNLLLMYAEGHTVVFSLYNYSFLGPTFSNRYRPMTYYNEFPMQERENGDNRNSFYSGHVATTAFTSFFMAKVYYDYHPEIGAKKYLLYAAALIPAVGMAYCRTRSLDHFPSDDAVGFLVGAALGMIIPDLHHIHPKNISIGMFTPPGAMGLSFLWTASTK